MGFCALFGAGDSRGYYVLISVLMLLLKMNNIKNFEFK